MQAEKIPAIVGGLGYSPADENKHQRYNGGEIHMGIFSRIGDIMKANVNDLIDKAEDPEKMVKQIIRDLQQEVAKSTQALGKAIDFSTSDGIITILFLVAMAAVDVLYAVKLIRGSGK